MVMAKQLLRIQDDNPTNIGTCQVSYGVTLSEQYDWSHCIFGGTNIFLHSFPGLIYFESGAQDQIYAYQDGLVDNVSVKCSTS